jgi:hypothetical protein
MKKEQPNDLQKAAYKNTLKLLRAFLKKEKIKGAKLKIVFEQRRPVLRISGLKDDRALAKIAIDKHSQSRPRY